VRASCNAAARCSVNSLWTDKFGFLSRHGQVDIQSDLFYDYRTNVDSYPKWQAWMRELRCKKCGSPKTLGIRAILQR